MAVRDDPPAAVQEIGRGRVGPIGIVLTATVLLLGTILLLYALIQFWPPVPPAATTGAALTTSTSTATTAASEAASGTTGQAAVEPAVQFFGATINLSREGRLFVTVLLAGGLGGMVHTLRSLYWYVGNRNLRYSWLLMYATLPITGAALALIAYLVLRGGLTTTFASSQDISPFGMAAVAALVGLFSRETAEKLKSVFETLLAPAEKGKDQAVPVRVEGIKPATSPVGSDVTITGTGLAAATAVQFGGVRAAPTVISDTELRVKVPEGAAKGPISVVTPTGVAASTDTFVPGAAEAPATD
jgi:IPT/TIG domain